MIKLDKNFLKDLGLGALPPQESQKMLSHIYDTLEMRVGMKLASGMSDAQLSEFEGIISGDVTNGRSFLDSFQPGWEQSSEYRQSAEKAKEETQVIKQFAALKWLETNFPGYKKVVEEELEKLKGEVREAAPRILEETNKLP